MLDLRILRVPRSGDITFAPGSLKPTLTNAPREVRGRSLRKEQVSLIANVFHPAESERHRGNIQHGRGTRAIMGLFNGVNHIWSQPRRRRRSTIDPPQCHHA